MPPAPRGRGRRRLHLLRRRRPAMALHAVRQGQRRCRRSLWTLPAVRRRTRNARRAGSRPGAGARRHPQGVRDRTWRPGVLPARRSRHRRTDPQGPVRGARADGERTHADAVAALSRRSASGPGDRRSGRGGGLRRRRQPAGGSGEPVPHRHRAREPRFCVFRRLRDPSRRRVGRAATVSGTRRRGARARPDAGHRVRALAARQAGAARGALNICMPTPDTPPPVTHHTPKDLSDRVALAMTRSLRFFADVFFARRYGHRAVVLETVAAVPGMVGGALQHLRSLRRLESDRGWIQTLLDEAENERMHLMTFVLIARPSALERLLILLAQGVFYNCFFLLYLISSRTAH